MGRVRFDVGGTGEGIQVKRSKVSIPRLESASLVGQMQFRDGSNRTYEYVSVVQTTMHRTRLSRCTECLPTIVYAIVTELADHPDTLIGWVEQAMHSKRWHNTAWPSALHAGNSFACGYPISLAL